MTTLTEDQRARLNSRPVAILRGLILDMLGGAEEAAIDYACEATSTTANATVSAREVLAHGSRTLAMYVSDGHPSQNILVFWDAEKHCSDTGKALAPWRARLAAALEICKRPGCAYC